MKLCALPLFLAVCTPISIVAAETETTGVQSIQQNGSTVTVQVNDALGEVIGANVIVKGTTIGGITDMMGQVVIQNVPNGATLVISYIGYVTQEIVLEPGQTSLEVTLAEDSETLEEVVVVGYGVTKRKNFTGSVATMNVADGAVANMAPTSSADMLPRLTYTHGS